MASCRDEFADDPPTLLAFGLTHGDAGQERYINAILSREVPAPCGVVIDCVFLEEDYRIQGPIDDYLAGVRSYHDSVDRFHRRGQRRLGLNNVNHGPATKRLLDTARAFGVRVIAVDVLYTSKILDAVRAPSRANVSIFLFERNLAMAEQIESEMERCRTGLVLVGGNHLDPVFGPDTLQEYAAQWGIRVAPFELEFVQPDPYGFLTSLPPPEAKLEESFGVDEPDELWLR